MIIQMTVIALSYLSQKVILTLRISSMNLLFSACQLRVLTHLGNVMTR